MSKRRCCCAGCSTTSCAPVLSDCSSIGLASFSVDITASARLPACQRSVCNVVECESPGSVTYEIRGGCLPCNIYTCTPCEYFPTTGSVMYVGQISYKSADPYTDNATCDYTWSQGYTWTPRVCGPTSEFLCYDNPTVVDAGCAILTYQTITRTDTVGFAQFKTCGNGTVGPLPTSTDGLYGLPCDGCNTFPAPCCCTDCTGDCHNIKMPYELVMEGKNIPKYGIIYCRILEMIPCVGPSVANKYFCGSNCDGADNYSQITIEFRAVIPTDVVKGTDVYFQRCIDVTPGSDYGRVRLPVAVNAVDAGSADEAGDFWCVGENSVVVTFRLCRTTANSFENKCRMQSGTYAPVYVGMGNCPLLNPCDVPVPDACDVSGIDRFLKAKGWSFNVVIP